MECRLPLNPHCFRITLQAKLLCARDHTRAVFQPRPLHHPPHEIKGGHAQVKAQRGQAVPKLPAMPARRVQRMRDHAADTPKPFRGKNEFQLSTRNIFYAKSWVAMKATPSRSRGGTLRFLPCGMPHTPQPLASLGAPNASRTTSPTWGHCISLLWHPKVAEPPSIGESCI